MIPHPLDPIALVFGSVFMLSGVIAVLHQAGSISLGVTSVVLLGLVTVGIAGAAIVALQLVGGRKPTGDGDGDGDADIAET